MSHPKESKGSSYFDFINVKANEISSFKKDRKILGENVQEAIEEINYSS